MWQLWVHYIGNMGTKVCVFSNTLTLRTKKSSFLILTLDGLSSSKRRTFNKQNKCKRNKMCHLGLKKVVGAKTIEFLTLKREIGQLKKIWVSYFSILYNISKFHRNRSESMNGLSLLVKILEKLKKTKLKK